MPIDAFFRSLAEDCGERAVGIILSGTGTDGTQGLRAIVGAGGIGLVQDPATAKYDGMPMSAINAGFATHLMAVEAMPQALLGGAATVAWPGQGRGTQDCRAGVDRPSTRHHPDAAARRHRSRLFALQEEHRGETHRPAHVAARHRRRGWLRWLSQGPSGRVADPLQGSC